MADWKTQAQNAALRKYEPIPKHSGGYTGGAQGTIMDLGAAAAGVELRAAVFDPAAALGNKAPSLWGYRSGRIYRFMWDNQGAWHGYPAEEKPPNAVLQQWRDNGTITEAEFGKIRKYPARGA
jgi:hypothetical protein